jgi:hypothetical protein
MTPIRVMAGKVEAAGVYGTEPIGDPIPKSAIGDLTNLLVGVRMSGQSVELVKLFTEIAHERSRQDEQWGGPAHDDDHGVEDWRRFREKFEDYISDADDVRPVQSTDRWADYTREQLVKIAALAVAQIQSLDRLFPREVGE